MKLKPAGLALRVALWLALAGLVMAPLIAILLGAVSPGLLGQDTSGDGSLLSGSLWTALRNSLLLGVSVAFMVALVSAALALAMEHAPPPLANLWEALLFLPFLSAPYLLGLAWSALALPGSIFGRHLGVLGPWLSHFVFSLPGVAFITATHLVPLAYAMVRGYLAGTGQRFELAAQVHGLSRGRTFLYITLPRLAVPLTAGALLSFLAAIEEFGIPAMIGPYAGLTVLTTAVQSDLDVWPVNLVDAARTATLLLAMGMVAWSLYRRFDHSAGLDYSRPRGSTARVGWGGLLVVLWALITSVLPIAVLLVMSLLRADTLGLQWDNLTLVHFREVLQPGHSGYEALSTSVGLAFGSSIFALTIATAIASVQRSGRRDDQALDMITTLLNALPGIVLAVALVLVWNAPWNPIPLYGNRALLLVGYVTVLLPLVLRYARTAVARVEPRLLTAARVHGIGGPALWLRIVLPLMWPPLISGFAIAFAFALREFVVSVLLQPPGTDTVSTFIFNEAEQGDDGAAMAMAVVSLVVSFAAVGVLRWLQTRRTKMEPEAATAQPATVEA